MTKTTWIITDLNENIKTELTYYHFGKEPKFPGWYMEKGKAYEIEIIWHSELLRTPKLFFKCLTHFCIMKAAN